MKKRDMKERDMKKRRWGKLAVLLSATLLLQTPIAVLAQEGTGDVTSVTQETEISEEGEGAPNNIGTSSVSGNESKAVTLSSEADITPPVIESFTFQENGQTVEEDGELHFSLKAYDQDSEIESVYIYLYSGKLVDNDGNVNTSSGTGASLFRAMNFDQDKSAYVFSIRVSNLIDDRCPNVLWENCYVSRVIVKDTKDNETELKVRENDTSPYLYQCVLNRSKQEEKEYTFPKIVLGEEGKTYTAGEVVPISVTIADGEGHTIKDVAVSLSTTTAKDSHSEYIFMTYDAETKIAQGSWTIEDTTYPDVWQLNSIKVEDERNLGNHYISVTSQNVTVNITQEDFDIEAPVIEKVSLGDSQGKLLKAGDRVDITVWATDNGKLKDTANATFRMQFLEGVSDNWAYATLDYDEEAGAYKGSLQITEDMYPTEWYFEGCDVSDVKGNRTWTLPGMSNISMSGTGRKQPYYFMVEQNGTYVQPLVNVQVNWYGYAEDGTRELVHSKILENAPCRTTPGALFGDENVSVRTLNGMECIGWHTTDGNLLQPDEEIVIARNSNGNSTFDVYMAYEKIPICVNLRYLDEAGNWKWNQKVCYAEAGEDAAELMNRFLAEQSIPKVITPAGADKVQFSGWNKQEGMVTVEGSVQRKGEQSCYFIASYDGMEENTASVEITMYRMGEQGQLVTDIVRKYVPAGTTYDDILGGLESPETSGATFSKWQFYNYNTNASQKFSRYYNYELMVFACYEGKTLVTSNVRWFQGTDQTRVLYANRAVWMDTEQANVMTLEAAKERFTGNLEAPECYPGLRFASWSCYKSSSASEGQLLYNVSAEYENRYIVLNYNSYAHLNLPAVVLLAEKGEKITLPTSCEGYKNMIWKTYVNGVFTEVTELTVNSNTYVYCTAYTVDNGESGSESGGSYFAITSQPTAASVFDGEQATFTIEATGDGLTYQWQLCYAGDSTFRKCTFTGADTATLTVAATTARNGYKFRCVITNDKGESITSDAAVLTVNTRELGVSLVASQSTADPGDKVTFTAQGNGGDGNYQYKFIINDTANDKWYKLQDFSSNNTIEWTATTAGTKRIMVDIKDGTGKTVGKNVAVVVNGIPELSAKFTASAYEVNSGDTVTLTAAAMGGSGKYNYKFIINDKTNDNWYRLQDFGSNNVITWKATTPGIKRLMVDVVDSQGRKFGTNITITVK